MEQANHAQITVKLRKGKGPGKEQIAAAKRDGMSVDAWSTEALRGKL